MKYTEMIDYVVFRYFDVEKRDVDATTRASMRKALVRYAEECKIGGTDLYSASVPSQGGSRQISVDEFEHYLFERFHAYLLDNYADRVNRDALQSDYDRIVGMNSGDVYWEQKAQEITQEQNHYYENLGAEHALDDGDATSSDFESQIYEIRTRHMIEILFETYVGHYDTALLRHDLELKASIPDGYNPSVTPDQAKALARLDSPKAYITYKKGRKP